MEKKDEREKREEGKRKEGGGWRRTIEVKRVSSLVEAHAHAGFPALLVDDSEDKVSGGVEDGLDGGAGWGVGAVSEGFAGGGVLEGEGGVVRDAFEEKQRTELDLGRRARLS